MVLSQVSKKYVSKELAKEIHTKAAPFVKWLKEAEEESEGSEEEEEEHDENVEVKMFFSFYLNGSCMKLVWYRMFFQKKFIKFFLLIFLEYVLLIMEIVIKI